MVFAIEQHKWTCNTKGGRRCFSARNRAILMRGAMATKPARVETGAYETVMIDPGFCFSAGEWNYPDAPLRGLYARNRVYEGVTGMESFAPWLERLEKILFPGR
jgi:hypothetical protein